MDDNNALTTESRRSFIKRTAASTLGLGIVAQSASAHAGQKQLIVRGEDSGKHTYEIEMKPGGQISKGANIENHDKVFSSGGNEIAEGRLWNENEDRYTYTGEIKSIDGDGSLLFELPDGAFGSMDDIPVHGRGSGRHTYALGTKSGDIDLNTKDTEYVDSDDGGFWTEWHFRSDSVSGALRNRNMDSYELENGTALNTILLKQGQIKFGIAGEPLQTMLQCDYSLKIDHPHGDIGGPYTGRTFIKVEFSADRSGVKILDFPPIEAKYSTKIGQVTTTVTRIKNAGRTEGSFERSNGSVRMPLDLDFDHDTPLAGDSTASFDLKTKSRSESGFNLSGSPLQQGDLKLELSDVGQFQGGFLGGHGVKLELTGSLDDSPF